MQPTTHIYYVGKSNEVVIMENYLYWLAKNPLKKFISFQDAANEVYKIEKMYEEIPEMVLNKIKDESINKDRES